jgi:hypothetical protein
MTPTPIKKVVFMVTLWQMLCGEWASTTWVIGTSADMLSIAIERASALFPFWRGVFYQDAPKFVNRQTAQIFMPKFSYYSYLILPQNSDTI